MSTATQYTTTGIDLFFVTDNATLRNLNKVINRMVTELGKVQVESCRYDTHRHCVTVKWAPKPVTAAVLMAGLASYRKLGTDIATAVTRMTGKAVEYTGSEFYLQGDTVTDTLVDEVTALVGQ